MLVGGLVIVALHQCWRRGAAVIVFCYGLAFGAAWTLSAGVPNGLHVDGELSARTECAAANSLRLLSVDRALSDVRGLDVSTKSIYDLARDKLYHRLAPSSVTFNPRRRFKKRRKV